MLYDVIIIGGGPAAVTAAIYTARKYLPTFLLTKNFEGQIFSSAKIENYSGFEEISGAEIARKFKKHLLKFSSLASEPEPGEVKIEEGIAAKKISKAVNGNWQVETENGEKFESRAVIIATGASPRKLNISGAERFQGKGIAFCETCDGPIFKEKNVAVVGGGNAGLEAAEELSGYAKKVYLLESQKELPGDSLLVGRLKRKENVDIIKNIELREVRGKNFVEKILYLEKNKNQGRELQVSGVFVKIGQTPNSNFVKGFLALNEKEEIIVNPKTLETSKKGIFAAGDVTDVLQKQYIIAAGEGAKSAISVYGYLKNRVQN